jgi:hypothetical protein
MNIPWLKMLSIVAGVSPQQGILSSKREAV